MITFNEWLRTVCFQPPTKEAEDLARAAWDKAKAIAYEEAMKAILESAHD